MHERQKFTPEIEKMVKSLINNGSPSARWLLSILLNEIDYLRKEINRIRPICMVDVPTQEKH